MVSFSKKMLTLSSCLVVMVSYLVDDDVNLSELDSVCGRTFMMLGFKV